MRYPTVFILFLQLYNVDMTFQNNFDTIIYICKRALTIFQIITLFLPPFHHQMTKIKPLLGPLIIFVLILTKMVEFLFHLFCVTFLQLLQYKAGQRATCNKELFCPPPPPMRLKYKN